MESQPQNPEFRNNPEKFHSCYMNPTTVLMSHILYIHVYSYIYTTIILITLSALTKLTLPALTQFTLSALTRLAS